MMKRTLELSFALLFVLCLALPTSSCSDDDDGREVSAANIVGTWSKIYPKDVVAEGYERVVFKPSGKGYVEVYNALATDSTTATTDLGFTFAVDSDKGKVTLRYDDGKAESYYITKLTASHMTWFMDILDDADHTENFKRLD